MRLVGGGGGGYVLPDPLWLASGTAAAPTYSFGTSHGAGMFLVSADILGFSTSGAEAFRVLANGNVTFNNDVVVTGDLTVSGTTTQLNTDVVVTGDLTVSGTTTQLDTDVYVTDQWFVTNAGTGPAVIINQTGANDIMDIQDDGVSVLYVEDGGNVGIGTASPTAKLEVVGDIISKGTNWTIRTSAADNGWYNVTYGNGLFVAVAYDGTGNRVMTSPDGINWTIRTSAADNAWRAVAYGNGLFVAVADDGTGNRVMTSPDGINWTIRTSAADNNWRAVTYGNGLFVAVAYSGTGNRVMTSPDGINWTSRTSAANISWRAVTYGNGLFVAVAYSGTGNRVMTSPDGINWTLRTSAADNGWSAVTYGNGLFVAVAYDGTGNRVMTSPDGINWTIRTSAADNDWIGVTYGNGLFVAVAYSGTGNRVMTSPDGINWTLRTSAADNAWIGVTYGNGLFVAVAAGGTGNRVMTSGKQDLIEQYSNIHNGDQTFTGDVGIGTTSPDASSLLDLTSTTKGFLPPRMTTTQKNAIASPATGLQVYDTTIGATQEYTGSAWQAIGSSAVSPSFADGTAAAPAISFTADTDTGFYRIGANTLGISSGGNNVANFTTGGLGIGVNPAYALHAYGASGIVIASESGGTGNAHLMVKNTEGVYTCNVDSSGNFNIYDSTAAVDRFTLDSTGGIQIGSPTGGGKGAGTINAASGLYSNGDLIKDVSFRARATGPQSISASTWTKVSLGAKFWDTNGDFDSSTNYRFTPTIAGKYHIGGRVTFPSLDADVAIIFAIRKNGSQSDVEYTTISTNPLAMTVSIDTLVEANGSTDYFELYVYHASSGSESTSGGASETMMYGHRVSS